MLWVSPARAPGRTPHHDAKDKHAGEKPWSKREYDAIARISGVPLNWLKFWGQRLK